METECGLCCNRYCDSAGTDRFVAVCSGYTREPQPMTNADRIRAMSDEELANFLHNVVCKFMCEYCKEYERIKAAYGHANCNGECDKAYLTWLKQPVEEKI